MRCNVIAGVEGAKISVKNAKTVMRTVRLAKDLDDLLGEDAQKGGWTRRTHQILIRHADQERWRGKFGSVYLRGETF